MAPNNTQYIFYETQCVQYIFYATLMRLKLISREAYWYAAHAIDQR